MLKGRAIANGADRGKLRQIKALVVTCRDISHFVSFIKFHQNSASHIVNQRRGDMLKELGHAILGNFSTDQIVIESTKISKERLQTIDEL